jgi:hypothetical protein
MTVLPVHITAGALALFAAAGDLRLVLRKALPPHLRLARHVWRMCFGLWIATSSFFLDQAKVFPAQFRIMPLLALPVVLVLAVMIYWLVRVLRRRSPALERQAA